MKIQKKYGDKIKDMTDGDYNQEVLKERLKTNLYKYTTHGVKVHNRKYEEDVAKEIIEKNNEARVYDKLVKSLTYYFIEKKQLYSNTITLTANNYQELMQEPSRNLKYITQLLYNSAKFEDAEQKDILFGQSLTKLSFFLEGLDIQTKGIEHLKVINDSLTYI